MDCVRKTKHKNKHTHNLKHIYYSRTEEQSTYCVWFKVSGTEEETVGGAVGEAEDVEVLLESDKIGQDQKRTHQMDSSCWMFRGQTQRGLIKMVWTEKG